MKGGIEKLLRWDLCVPTTIGAMAYKALGKTKAAVADFAKAKRLEK